MVKLVIIVCLLVCSFQLQSMEITIGVNQRDIYRMKSEEGIWTGLDIELIAAVFRRTPHTFKVIDMPWTRVLKSIETGSVDITLAAAVAPERENYAFFSQQKFRYSHYTLFVIKNKLDLFQSVTTLADLSETKVLVGALRGAIYSDSYYSLLKNEAFSQHIAYIDNDQNMPNFALKGRVDAYIDSEIEGKAYLGKHPKYNDHIVPFLQITTVEEAKSYLMFSKKTLSKKIVEQFDETLKDLHNSGEYQKITHKYSPIDNHLAIGGEKHKMH